MKIKLRTIIGVIRSRTSSSVNELTSTIVFDGLGIISNGSSSVGVLFWDEWKSFRLFKLGADSSDREGYERKVRDLCLSVP